MQSDIVRRKKALAPANMAKKTVHCLLTLNFLISKRELLNREIEVSLTLDLCIYVTVGSVYCGKF